MGALAGAAAGRLTAALPDVGLTPFFAIAVVREATVVTGDVALVVKPLVVAKVLARVVAPVRSSGSFTTPPSAAASAARWAR